MNSLAPSPAGSQLEKDDDRLHIEHHESIMLGMASPNLSWCQEIDPPRIAAVVVTSSQFKHMVKDMGSEMCESCLEAIGPIDPCNCYQCSPSDNPMPGVIVNHVPELDILICRVENYVFLPDETVKSVMIEYAKKYSLGIDPASCFHKTKNKGAVATIYNTGVGSCVECLSEQDNYISDAATIRKLVTEGLIDYESKESDPTALESWCYVHDENNCCERSGPSILMDKYGTTFHCRGCGGGLRLEVDENTLKAILTCADPSCGLYFNTNISVILEDVHAPENAQFFQNANSTIPDHLERTPEGTLVRLCPDCEPDLDPDEGIKILPKLCDFHQRMHELMSGGIN